MINAADSSQELITVQKLLEIISRTVPGQLECLFLLGRTRFLRGDDEGAIRALDQCLKLSPAYADVSISIYYHLLLLAFIFLLLFVGTHFDGTITTEEREL